MHLPLNRLARVLILLLFALLPAGALAQNPPVFQVGSSSTSPDPYYAQSPFNTVPVGKTLVLPVVVSGSGPLTYSVTSSSPALAPVVKTGYPVMSISVSYSGTTSVSGMVNTLYSFTDGSDGANPYGTLIQAADGNFYGTTGTGLSNAGTVFQITTGGSLTTLYTFTGGSDGGASRAGLLQGTGVNFYGTTSGGGTGAGTVFQVTASGSLTTLHSFGSIPDGQIPYAPLVTGTDGNYYGTTFEGGTSGAGTIFQVTTSGSLSVIYSFSGGSDGGFPYAGLISGTDGNLYGTTSQDGAGYGTVFQVTTTGSLTTLYSFTNGSDGANPYAGLVQGIDGNFYGTTETSGTGGTGTVFQLTASGSLATLYGFSPLSSGTNADGANPHAGLVLANNGFFYGTAENGGANGTGTVFQVASSGSFATIHSFGALSSGTNADGASPFAGLVQATDGNLYGTAETGGTAGGGTVFQVPVSTTPAFSGTMAFALFRDMAPVTTGYIAGLAEAGYYNNLDFFRITNLNSSPVEPATFIAQGGDPTETGTGSLGFSFNNELIPSLIFTGEGQLAMANAGNDQTTFQGTDGSQFFITQGSLRSLDFGYTIFGQLLSGFDIMQKVMAVPLESDGSSPTVPVVMDSVTVSEDNTDAIILVSAPGYVPNGATIKVSATDPSGNKAVTTGTIPELSITVSTPVQDSVNDPPIIDPEPNINVGLHQRVSFPVRAQDLEFDYLITDALQLAGSGGTLFFNGSIATVTPSAFSPVGSVTAGLDVYQPYVSVERSNQYDQTAVIVGLGSGKLTSFPGLFVGNPGVPLASSTATVITSSSASIFGSFLSSNPAGGADDFTASINWGDGTLVSSSNGVSIVQSPRIPTEYDISYPPGHTYSNSGIYPLNVTVTNTNGGILQVQNTAVVSSGPIYPFGRTFTASKGLANALVATFVDYSPFVIAADYQAIINWGDGSVGKGIIRGSNGSFMVYGQHKYAAGTTYPVDVTVNSLINSNSGYAWSIAQLTGVPTRQPPFAQSHISGQIGNPGFNGLDLDEEVVLVNSGNIASGPIALRFYLSSTTTIDASAIPLAVGKGSTYNTPSIAPGSAIQGSVSDITLPANAVTRGKYIIMQVITSDPIGNHMDYPRTFADPYPLIE
jgi:uncharacterized repeat protein (TIGR03803 family)